MTTTQAIAAPSAMSPSRGASGAAASGICVAVAHTSTGMSAPAGRRCASG
jgi:hypothetical protein